MKIRKHFSGFGIICLLSSSLVLASDRPAPLPLKQLGTTDQERKDVIVDGEGKEDAVAQPPSSTTTVAPFSLVQKLGEVAADKLGELAMDSDMRVRTYKNNPALLKSGIYYGNVYATILQEQKQSPRFNFLKTKDSFYHGYVPAKYFAKVADLKSPSGFKACSSVLKQGEAAGAALASLHTDLALMDCGSTTVVAYYEALQAVLGVEKFEAIFGGNSATPMRIDFLAAGNPLVPLMQTVPAEAPFLRGQIASFLGIAEYSCKHPNGEAANFNLICTDATPGRERFVGLGTSKDGVNKEELTQLFIDEFNSTPIGWEIFSEPLAKAIRSSYSEPFLAQAEVLAKVTLDQTGFKFLASGGAKLHCRYGFRGDRVEALLNATVKEASVLVARWNGLGER